MYRFRDSSVSRLAWLAGGCFLLFLLAVSGCSSNQSTAPGNPNDPLYLAAKNVVDSALVPQVMATMGEGVANEDGFAPDTGSFQFFPRPVAGASRPATFWNRLRPAAPESAQSGYQNGWHYFIYDTTGTLDSNGTTGTVHFADSVQFQNASGPQQNPDTSTNRFQVIFLLQADLQRGSDSAEGQLYSNHTFQRSGNTLTLNGTERDSVRYTEGAKRFLFKLNHTVNNVVFQKNPADSTKYEHCPVSGSVRFLGSIFASGPNGFFFAGVDITVVFQGGGVIRVVVIDSDRHLRWEYLRGNICQLAS